MSDEERRKYIKQVWSISNGHKITEMLRRHWKLSLVPRVKIDSYETAKNIFATEDLKENLG